MEWMILPLRRYAQFTGRSQRKEYWMFVLLSVIVSLVLNILDSALGLGGHASSYATQGANGFAAGSYSSGGVLSSIWSLGILVPSIAVGVRRLHDIDRTGWWLLVLLLPIFLGTIMLVVTAMAVVSAQQPFGSGGGSSMIGGVLLFLVGGIASIVLLVWFCLDGTHGANRFGPNPKGLAGDLHETFR